MLFINNPQAANAILEGRRHAEGQRITTAKVPQTSGGDRPTRDFRKSRRHLAPLVATSR